MCSGSEAGSYLTLTCFVSLNPKLESNREEKKEKGGTLMYSGRRNPMRSLKNTDTGGRITCAEGKLRSFKIALVRYKQFGGGLIEPTMVIVYSLPLYDQDLAAKKRAGMGYRL